MYSKIIKRKRKIPYIVLGVISFITIVILTINNIKVFNHQEIDRLKNLLEKSKTTSYILDSDLKDLIEKNKSIFKNSINDKNLANDLKTLCDTFVKNEVLKNCFVSDVKSPYQYSNVAKFTINSSDEADKLIIKRVIGQIYYIKNINELPSGVEIEIFNKIN
jgi:hypothetical protein